MYCPHCTDLEDGQPIILDKYKGIFYCSGPYGEGGCGFHYDPVTGERFSFADKKCLWFWVPLCILTLGRVHCQKRVKYRWQMYPGELEE